MTNPNDLEYVVALAKRYGAIVTTKHKLDVGGTALCLYREELTCLVQAYAAKQSAADKAEIERLKAERDADLCFEAKYQIASYANDELKEKVAGLSAKLARYEHEQQCKVQRSK